MKPAAARISRSLKLLSGLALGLLLLAGCTTTPRHETNNRWGATERIIIPAQIISNFFVITCSGSDGTTHHFIIDTGSTATLISPALAQRYRQKTPANEPLAKIKVRSANGGEIALEPVRLRRLPLGATVLENVPALLFDFADLSAHLGVVIDGLIGFPVFNDVLLTLDYPKAQLTIAPLPLITAAPPSSPRSSTLNFSHEHPTPLISLQMGNESFIAQIDTGSDGSLNLNPSGLHPRFVNEPRAGTLISSLQGDRQQLSGRLNQNVLLGDHLIERPIIDLSEQLSSIGGEFLRHFTLTFDQHHHQVTFVRDTLGPVTMEPRRSTGLSFSRGPTTWRVLTVIPNTPAEQFSVKAGDLCIRINGELVKDWDFIRYAALIKSTAKITYTFLAGPKEIDLELPVFELVP